MPGRLPLPLPVGKKHVELASKWLPSLSVFGMSAGIGVLYFTDWKTVLQYVPYYSGKFKTED